MAKHEQKRAALAAEAARESGAADAPASANGAEVEVSKHCDFCSPERPCLAEWTRAGYSEEGYATEFGADAFQSAQLHAQILAEPAVKDPAPATRGPAKAGHGYFQVGPDSAVFSGGLTHNPGDVAEFPLDHGLPELLSAVE